MIALVTPIGTIYMCGFMSLFGASSDFRKAMTSMQVASEAQVHYAIDGAFK
jgi:hypothetical protein